MTDAGSPIVFVHYGPARYVRWALASARKSNPETRVVFLGDESNRANAAGVADFYLFDDFGFGELINEFDNSFVVLQGENHRFTKQGGIEAWLRFVFRRWFLIGEFLECEEIDSFWTFDSDTLIFSLLRSREDRFAGYEATTQCRNCCLNGFVRSRVLVERYTRCVLQLFKDRDYLASERERLIRQAGLASNEMDAFGEFRRRENVRTFHAAQPLEGEFFDDALAYDANFEASSLKVAGHIQVKRLWSSPDGALYAKHLASGSFVRMITCNLSWLPDYVGKKLARYCLSPEQDAKVRPPVESELCEIDLSQPLTDKIATALKRKVFEVKRALGKRGRKG
jgi:hypothetical protein